jgi:hypothetical protein
MSRTRASLVGRHVRLKLRSSTAVAQVYPWINQRRWFQVLAEFKQGKRRWAVQLKGPGQDQDGVFWRTSVRLPVGKAEKQLAFNETGCK